MRFPLPYITRAHASFTHSQNWPYLCAALYCTVLYCTEDLALTSPTDRLVGFLRPEPGVEVDPNLIDRIHAKQTSSRRADFRLLRPQSRAEVLASRSVLSTSHTKNLFCPILLCRLPTWKGATLRSSLIVLIGCAPSSDFLKHGAMGRDSYCVKLSYRPELRTAHGHANVCSVESTQSMWRHGEGR